MNYRLMLLGSTANFAPENDQGAYPDDREDIDEGDEEQDEGDEDDALDPDDEQDDDADEGDDPPEPRQPTRGETRLQRLANEKKASDDRAAAAERRAEEAERRANQGPVKSREQLAAERTAHLATLTEAGRLEFLLNEERHERQQGQARIEFQTYDANDKAAFAAMCARNPAAAKLEAEVEKRLKEHRDGGQNATREAVLKFLLGERALAKSGRAKSAGQRREAEGRDRQTARPMNGRGDAAPSGQRRTSEAEARRKRLEGMQI